MDKYDLAKALFGGGQQSQEAGSTTVLYGRAAGDSANGRVDVSLNGVTYASEGAGPSIQMDTTTDVRAGETVIVTVVDGHPVVTGVVGGGDRLRTDVGAAAGAARSAQESAGAAKSTAQAASGTATAAKSTADKAQSTAEDAWSRTLRVQVSSSPADAAGDTSTLTATVWRGGERLTEQEVAMMGLVAWYVGGSRVSTGYTYTCAAGTAVECRLEA